tara:strand:- start:349 stop:450 length:102 start_codon:yes stop_codon:yes gene_type:complete
MARAFPLAGMFSCPRRCRAATHGDPQKMVVKDK